MNLLFFQFRKLLHAKVVVLEIAVGGERIDSRQFQKLLDSVLTRKRLSVLSRICAACIWRK